MASTSNNSLLIIIAVVIAAGVGYFIWQDQQKDTISLTLPGGGDAKIELPSN